MGDKNSLLGIQNFYVPLLFPADHIVKPFLVIVSGQWSFNDCRI